MQSTDKPAAPAAVSIDTLKAAQNFPAAIGAGLAVAVGGAILWAVVTVGTHLKLGIMAIAIGFLVGKSIRAAGKGIDDKFGYLGAGCSFIGCLLGNILCLAAFYANARHISFMEAFSALDADIFARALTRDPMDLVFYAIAIYEGYKFSFKYRLRKPE
jgi:hypothetical protein